MSEKVHCCQCGKTIAVETEVEIQIKCTGKHNGGKCGCVNNINRITGEITFVLPDPNKPKYEHLTNKTLTETKFYDHTKME